MKLRLPVLQSPLRLLSASLLIVLLPLLGLLSGCALTSTTLRDAAKGLSLHGNVHGGQQPIAGSHVYLLAADATGYGNASHSLLSASATGLSDNLGAYVTTDANGGWDITGDYTCLPNQQVYLLAQGGDPGAGINTAAGLMAVLGSCPSSGSFAASIPYVSINEVTTVAAGYAMSGYAVDATHVASSGSAAALAGIANAFANASLLSDVTTGAARASTPNGNGSVPVAQVNLLANILAACINSTGPGSSSCTTLLADATSDGTPSGVAPSETASAVIHIAHNPGANLPDLFNLPPATSPFAPTPSTQPNDLTIAVTYTGGGLNAPSSIAIDAQGNAWISNQGSSSVSVFSALGIPSSGSPYSGNGVNAPTQVALDLQGNAWVANNGAMSISEFDAGFNAVAGSPFGGGGINTPDALAIDPTGNVWVASPFTNNVTLLSNVTAAPSATSITGDGLTYPVNVSIDQTGNAWIVNQSANSVTILDHHGTPLARSPVTGGGLSTPYALAIDAAGNAWVANYASSSITVLDPTGSPLAGTQISGGGINYPVALTFDGGGNLWIANNAGNGLAELGSNGSPVLGSPFTSPSSGTPYSVAVDGSGSVWLVNQGGNSLTELIGAAVPAVTPLSLAIRGNHVGARP